MSAKKYKACAPSVASISGDRIDVHAILATGCRRIIEHAKTLMSVRCTKSIICAWAFVTIHRDRIDARVRPDINWVWTGEHVKVRVYNFTTLEFRHVNQLTPFQTSMSAKHNRFAEIIMKFVQMCAEAIDARRLRVRQTIKLIRKRKSKNATIFCDLCVQIN